MEGEMKACVLLVDDEPNVLAALKRALQDEPYMIFTAASGEDAIARMTERRFNVVVSDELMPGMDGSEFLSIVKERWPETVRMMLTGHASVEATMRAVNSGEIYRFFTKPWDDVMLQLAIRSAIEKYMLEEENMRLLRTIRRQSQEMKMLEEHYPGISEIKKSEFGAIELPDINDDELQKIIDRYGLI